MTFKLYVEMMDLQSIYIEVMDALLKHDVNKLLVMADMLEENNLDPVLFPILRALRGDRQELVGLVSDAFDSWVGEEWEMLRPDHHPAEGHISYYNDTGFDEIYYSFQNGQWYQSKLIEPANRAPYYWRGKVNIRKVPIDVIKMWILNAISYGTAQA